MMARRRSAWSSMRGQASTGLDGAADMRRCRGHRMSLDAEMAHDLGEVELVGDG
ncbi:MAG: hypothetical protein R3D03_07850 [Geminicoccaceae bacterium]